MHIGIDYGSKLAGTTSICYLSKDSLHFETSKKKQDADGMISSFIKEHTKVSQVFIDAPLSLPKVYSDPNSNSTDFFYRASDREVKAMSPMFLGGLTARAMKLSRSFSSKGINFFESYPSGLIDVLELDRTHYKKESAHLTTIANTILDRFQLNVERMPASWHEVDALLAFIVGNRYQEGVAKHVGDPQEGLIYF